MTSLLLGGGLMLATGLALLVYYHVDQALQLRSLLSLAEHTARAQDRILDTAEVA